VTIEITKETWAWEQAQQNLATLEQGEEHGFRQRSKSDGRLSKYLDDMLSGTFLTEVAAPMAFHRLGFIVDGQHRATAQVRAKLTLTWWVMRGLEDADVRVLDVGKSRSVPDVFRMMGLQNTTRLSSAIRKLFGLAGGNVKEALSPPFAEKILNNHPRIDDSVRVAKTIPSFVGADANFAAAHYIAAYIDKKPDLALEYISILAKGWLPDGRFPERTTNAASKLREHLMGLRVESRGKRMRVDSDLLLRSAVHGWQMYSAGEVVKSIRIPDKVIVEGWDLDACLGPIKEKKERNVKKRRGSS